MGLIKQVTLKLITYVNRGIYKLRGVKYGENMNIFGKVYINKHKDAELKIGDDFIFTSGYGLNAISGNVQGSFYIPKPGASIIIGDKVGISASCLWANNNITIGNRVLIGAGTLIIDTDAHSLNYKIRGSRERDLNGQYLDDLNARTLPITIEDDVFIGAKCIILKGVTIGARSIIGAGSVVSSSIPSDCIAAGNPCIVVKSYRK